MNFSLDRIRIIARREYLTVVKRKAFIFALVYTPMLLYFSTFLSTKLARDDSREHFRQARVVALVDSSGLFSGAVRSFMYHPGGAIVAADSVDKPHRGPARPTVRDSVPVTIRDFATQKVALDSLDAGTVTSALVIPEDFLTTGRVRHYEKDSRAVTATSDDVPLRWWLARSLLLGTSDSLHVARAWGLGGELPHYTPSRDGGYRLKDDTRELVSVFLPFVVGLLLGMAIMMGGQYMLQGISEEKESRILESLLCTVTADDLLFGKLIGLGGAGLTLVGAWVLAGSAIMGTSMAFMHIELPMQLLVYGLLYFLGAYVFYGSLMIGIGAVTNNMREAQQFSASFTMMNFFPFFIMMKVVNTPNSGAAVALSLFPPTSATTMIMRLAAASMSGAVIPAWQVALSLGLLFVTAIVVLLLSAKVFRIGLLLYGKTPNLPEILAILRQK